MRGEKRGSELDGRQEEKAVALLQGCVQLNGAMQSSYPVTRFGSRFLGDYLFQSFSVLLSPAWNEMHAAPPERS